MGWEAGDGGPGGPDPTSEIPAEAEDAAHAVVFVVVLAEVFAAVVGAGGFVGQIGGRGVNGPVAPEFIAGGEVERGAWQLEAADAERGVGRELEERAAAIEEGEAGVQRAFFVFEAGVDGVLDLVEERDLGADEGGEAGVQFGVDVRVIDRGAEAVERRGEKLELRVEAELLAGETAAGRVAKRGDADVGVTAEGFDLGLAIDGILQLFVETPAEREPTEPR